MQDDLQMEKQLGRGPRPLPYKANSVCKQPNKKKEKNLAHVLTIT